MDVVFTDDRHGHDAADGDQPEPGGGATNVPTTTTVSATFSEPVAVLDREHRAHRRPTGTRGRRRPPSYNSSTQTATFTPSAALAVSTTYTAKVSGAADTRGNVMTPVTWTFTTSSSTSGCPCTIWPSTTTPTTVDSNDASAVELGVKFRLERGRLHHRNPVLQVRRQHRDPHGFAVERDRHPPLHCHVQR